MSAEATEPQASRRAALQHVADVLRLCLTGRPRRGVLGFASGRGSRTAWARWRALPSAIGQVIRPRREQPVVAEWLLAREAGGWAVRSAASPDAAPAYFTAAIGVDDQNAAFDWAAEVTPGVDRKRISYVGPPPA